MNFKPIFFYEDGAEGTGTGGDNTATDTLENSGEQQQQQEIPKPLLSDDELKNYGFDSPDALKTFLSNRKSQEQEASITPEQKKEQENIEKANLLKFAADQKLLTVDDYTQYETLKAKSDRDLVFESFKTEFATDNPEITDPEELNEAAEEEFKYINKLNDPKGLEKAEKRWAKEAKEIRSPYESKITEAQEQFKENESVKQNYPKFDKFVSELITKNTPTKLSTVTVKAGETEIPIEIELTEKEVTEMRDSMAKSFKTHKAYKTFIDLKPEEAQKVLDQKMQGWVFQNKKEAIVAKAFEAGTGIGRANGSFVGATNPFPLINSSRAQHTGEETLEQSNARIAKEADRYRRTH